MKLFSSLITLLICVASLQTQAQQDYFIGNLIDGANGKVIENAHIIVQRPNAPKTGVTSDKNGEFTVIGNFPVSITISHLSYLSQTIHLTEKPKDGQLLVTLKGKTASLNTFTVNGNRIDTVFPDHKRNIWDYAFVDNHILVIDFYNRVAKGRLSLITFFGDTIATLPLPSRVDGFMRDCIGQLYILGPEEIHIVNWERGELSYSTSLNREKAMQALHGCVDSYWPFIYFEDGFGASTRQQYYAVNQMTTESALIDVIRDSVMEHQMSDDLLVQDPGLSSARGKFLFQYYLQSYGSPERAMRQIGYDKAFREQIVYVQGYNPLMVIGSKLFVFNHTESLLTTFDASGKVLKEVPIAYHKESSWDNKVLTDKVMNKAYALSHDRQGVPELREINLETGETGNPTRINFPHVENIQVQDGFIYFLYRGIGDTKKRLYRVAAGV